MKKLSTLLLALLLLLPCLASARTQTDIYAYVTIADGDGALVMAHVPVLVIDTDGDSTLTIADALTCAHAVWYPEGGRGFATENTQYGLAITRLWGIENGGSYSYCVNNASAWSLMDPIADGDHIVAYAYTDLVAWSDTYSYFDTASLTTVMGQSVTLTLYINGFDEAWNPVTLPVAGATLTVGDTSANVTTDETGSATLTFAEPGTYVVSAVSDTMTLVPPVCVVKVEAE